MKIDENEIIIITSRPLIFKERTEIWLKKHFPKVHYTLIHSNDFHSTNKTKSKADVCKELGIKIMIEDQDRYSLECAQSGIKVVLFDKAWNQSVVHSNIFRVKTWKEAINYIKIIESKDF